MITTFKNYDILFGILMFFSSYVSPFAGLLNSRYPNGPFVIVVADREGKKKKRLVGTRRKRREEIKANSKKSMRHSIISRQGQFSI